MLLFAAIFLFYCVKNNSESWSWSQLGRGPIENGMFSGGSDTISGHAPLRETQLRG